MNSYRRILWTDEAFPARRDGTLGLPTAGFDYPQPLYRKLSFALLILFFLVPVLLAAQPTDLLISEYIEGSSNSKAIELYNGTGSAIDLGAGNYILQYYFNGGTSVGLTITLSGTVADGDVFVVAHSSAAADILAVADLTNGSGWFNGDDAVVLRRGGTSGTVVDAIGQIGFDPGTEWGTGNTSTADNTLRRKETSCTPDTDPTDVFDPSVDFDGYANNTFDGLGAHTANCGGPAEDLPPTVSRTAPTNNSTGADPNGNITITFSEPVSLSGTWFAFTDENGASISASVSGSGGVYTIDPDQTLADETIYTVTIHAAGVTDLDGDADQMEEDYSFSFATSGLTLISAVQGSGTFSPMTGGVVTIEGIVVGDFQENDGDLTDLDGFYLQEEAEDQDNDPATSEGIFVYAPGGIDVQPGDIVRVTGRVSEFGSSGSSSTLTELVSVSSISIPGTAPLPEPIDVELPFPTADYAERYEGMLVRLPQDLVISEYFNYDRFNEIVLALPAGSLDRPYQPTSYLTPGSTEAVAAAELITRSRITLDDGRSIQNPDVTIHPNGDPFSLTNHFRGGDLVTNTTGILDERFDLYRIQPTTGADYTAVNNRTAQPDDVGGCLTIASFNVLNYFLTIDNGSDICGPNGGLECRGADNTTEFQRQRGKILAALTAIDADIFGLIELENTTGVEPLADIVAGLNNIKGGGTYDYIETGTIGTDAIRVGIIYKPGSVTPVGDHALLTTAVDARFVDTKNRPSLAQTFSENGSDEVFTVVVNHLKSKGSDCNDLNDPDGDDGQGNCNGTRTAAAEALVDWLATDPTGSNDPDYLIIGDLNSYDEEDPIRAIMEGSDDVVGTSDDFVDLVETFGGEFAYSYLFDGQFGYLDYGLASSTLASHVAGASEWHINADEPDLLDYDISFKSNGQDAIYAADPYRSSDHDPIVIGLDLGRPTITTNGSQISLWPANHRMQTISLDDLGLNVMDGCEGSIDDADIYISRVWSDEAENGNGDGNTTNDIVIGSDCRSVQLRAERDGGANGRVYTIELAVPDGTGNVGTTTVTVVVPVNRNGSAIDDGEVYVVEGCASQYGAARLAPNVEAETGDGFSYSGTFNEDGLVVRPLPHSTNPDRIEFELSEAATIRLLLVDVSGNEVRTLASEDRPAGKTTVAFDAEALPQGSYFIWLVAGNSVVTERLTIVR